MAGLKGEIDRLVRSDPPRALEVAAVLDRAARATPATPGCAATAARGRAMAKHANGRTAEALPDYLEAAKLHEEAGDELELGRVHRSLVDVHQMSGDPDAAMRSAGVAREIFERLGEVGLLAQLEANLGNVFVRLDDHPAARRHYEQACRLFEQRGEQLALAMTRYNLGVTETSTHAIVEARRSFTDSARVFSEHGMHVHKADCGYMLAYLQARSGRFADAITDLERTRQLYSDCGKPSGGPLCDLDLAEIYYRIDACRDALEHAVRAERGFAELGMDYERAKSSLFASLAHARLGQVQRALGEMEAARETFVRLGNRAWPAVLDLHRCAIELSTRSPGATPDARVVEELRTARAALAEQGLRLWERLASVGLARLLLARGDADAAAQELADVERSGGHREELDGLVKIEHRVALADVRESTADRDGAIAALREAVEAVEGTWSHVPGSDVRTAFFRTRHDAFARLALLLAARPESTPEAFEVLERGRLRSLRETRGARRADPELEGARERLDWLLARQLDAQLGTATGEREVHGEVTDEEVLAAQRELVALSRRGADTLDRERSHEAVAPGLQAALAPGELFVTWLLTERDSRALVVNATGVQAIPVAVCPAQVRTLGERLSFQLHKFELGHAHLERHRARLLASVHALLDELGALLLEPLVPLLEDARELVLVPYGPLHGLPLHALHVAGEPLVATHDVGYALSGFQLLATRRRSRSGRGVVFVSGEEDTLPAIAEERSALTGHYPDEVRSLPPDDLRAKLEEPAASGGVLHVSAHGAFQPGHPVFSGVRLGRTFLTAHDVAPLQLPYSVVTLSGCETGRLGHADGEEVFGLNRAFLGAGVQSVVSSLWPVADADCARFTDRLYTHLSRGADVRSALSRAQRERLREDPHPFSWASFTVCGDPRVRVPAGRTDSTLTASAPAAPENPDIRRRRPSP